MKKNFVLLIAAFAFSCSENEEQSCSDNLSNLTLDATSLYTGEEIALGSALICFGNDVTIQVNDHDVPLSRNKYDGIYFVVPAVTETLATVTVRVGKTERKFGPLPVVKAAGTWRAVAPFTATGRNGMTKFATTSDGYLYGGWTQGTTFTSYYNLYKYNVPGNTWSEVSTDVAFAGSSEAFDGSQLFLTGKTYSLNDNKFSSISYIAYRPDVRQYATRYFTCNGKAYAISNINYDAIEIQKYNAESNKWAIVQEVPYNDKGGEEYFDFAFAVEHQGISYVGVVFSNNDTVEVWAFDGATNSFSKVSSVINDIKASSRALRHLFTLNNLGYFIEIGESVISLDETVKILKPRSHFYVYNFTSNEWRKVKTEFPESMYGGSSLNIGNRGFAGLGASEGTTGFNYSQNFFEFVPTP